MNFSAMAAVETVSAFPESSPCSTEISAKASSRGELVGGNELALRKQALEVYEKTDLLLGAGRHHFFQYGAFSPMTHRIPPRGS
jgi:hypothetical protein